MVLRIRSTMLFREVLFKFTPNSSAPGTYQEIFIECPGYKLNANRTEHGPVGSLVCLASG